MKCACERFFALYSCGANVGNGECDCPKCQGYCDNCDKELNAHYAVQNGADPTNIELGPSYSSDYER